MNCIEKTATFVVALTITFLGATFAIAPFALTGQHSIAAHRHSGIEQVVACNTCAPPPGGALRAIDRY
jgi:hypothetical protein